jgi:hypothetical protein
VYFVVHNNTLKLEHVILITLYLIGEKNTDKIYWLVLIFVKIFVELTMN